MKNRSLLRCFSFVFALLATVELRAAPGDVLFFDNLNGNLNSWTVSSSGGNASIGNETSQQGRALRLRFGAVTITSDPFNAAVPAADFSVWIRRGDDSFSENPDNNEDLVVEYLNSSGSWINLQSYPGGGSPGEILTPVFTLPADALHSALRIRFRMTSGGPDPYDYWHIDNPTVTERAPAAPFGPGSCADFESGLGGFSVSASGGDAGVSSATANSGSSSLFTRWGVVSVTSPQADLAGLASVGVSAWVRRGDDNFSEDPDGGEDLVIEFFDDGGNWVLLETFSGSGTPGEVFTPVYSLPTPALHSAFRLRVRQLDGDGSDNDYWHVDDICLTSSEPVRYEFEETQWTGATGEVQDAGGLGLNGTVLNGGVNAQAFPAIAGNPGTCKYADFDGVDDYIEIPDDPAFDLPNALTIGAWINARSIPSSDLHTIVSKDWNYEFHINSAGQVFWYWNNSSGTVRTLTSSTTVNTGQWYYVTITYEPGSQVIYLDGNPVASSTFNETLRLNDVPFWIGYDLNFISRSWDGFIDEVRVYDRALSQSEIQAVMAETHPCQSVAPQFVVNHDSYGIHCLAETITVDVVDAAAGTPLTDYNATVVLDSQSGRGSWSLLGGSGSLSDATADDGLATYDWPLTESQAVFALFYPEGAASVDVDVFQQNNPGIRDTDTEGALLFSPNGFTLTASPLPNPPPGVILPFSDPQIAGVDVAVSIAAYGQTPNDPQCGIIESYNGSMPLQFWMYYQNPVSGSIVASVNGAAISTSEPASAVSPVDFTNGQANIILKYKDAGQIRLSVKDQSPADPDLAAGIRGATANFVVKPAELRVSGITDSGGGANPQAADANGAAFIAAGESFSATVTAYDAEGDVTPNFGQEATPETVRLVSALVAPAGGNNPAIAGASSIGPFTAGSATGAGLSWPEVGIISLSAAIADGDYLGAGAVTGPASPNVGRFIAHHFDTSSNVPLFDTACDAGGFTYIGENFGYATAPVVSFTAKALGGETLLNYQGDFFKMNGLAPPVYASTPATLDVSGLPGSGDPAVSSTGPGTGTLTFSSGSGLFFQKTVEEPVFSADIRLSQSIADTDGAAASVNPVVIGDLGGILFDAGAEMRYGRARLLNAYGSERVNLPVSLQTEYFLNTSVGFVANTDDSCSASVSIALSDFTDNLAAGETCVLDSGAPGASGAGCPAAAPVAAQFAAPPAAGDFNLNLQAPGDGNDGGATATADVPAWLEFDWDADSAGLEDPSANVTFGIYRGLSRRIYTRELY